MLKNLVCSGVPIVCDFDDTLYCTSDFHRRSFGRVLGVLGIEEDIPRSYGRLLRGKSDWDIFHALLLIARGGHPEMVRDMPGLALLPRGLNEAFPGSSIEEKMGQCVVMRRSFLLDAIEEKLPEEKPGLDRFVGWLRETGTICGIASSSPESFVQATVRGKETDDVFPTELVVGSETVEREERRLSRDRGSLSKPSPFSIYLAVERVRAIVGNQNHRIIYLGDTETDCLLARASMDTGLMGIIINQEQERKEELKKKFPELVFLDTLEDLVG